MLSRSAKIQEFLSITNGSLDKVAVPINPDESLQVANKTYEPGEVVPWGRLQEDVEYIYVLKLQNLDPNIPNATYPADQIYNEDTGEEIFNWYIGKAPNPIIRWLQHVRGRAYLSLKGYKLLNEKLKDSAPRSHHRIIINFLRKIRNDMTYFSNDPVDETFRMPGDNIALKDKINKILDLREDGSFGREIPGSMRCGAKWTIMHKPIEMVWLMQTEVEDTLQFENLMTQELVKKYGAEHVRGGSWCHILSMHKDPSLQLKPYPQQSEETGYNGNDHLTIQMKKDKKNNQSIIDYLNNASFAYDEELIESIDKWKINSLHRSFLIETMTEEEARRIAHSEERELIIEALIETKGLIGAAGMLLGYTNRNGDLLESKNAGEKMFRRIKAHEEDPEGPINVDDYRDRVERPSREEMMDALIAAGGLDINDVIWQGVAAFTARRWMQAAGISMQRDIKDPINQKIAEHIEGVLMKAWDFAIGQYNISYTHRQLAAEDPKNWHIDPSKEFNSPSILTGRIKRYGINLDEKIEKQLLWDHSDIKKALKDANGVVADAANILTQADKWGLFWSPPNGGEDPSFPWDYGKTLENRIKIENRRGAEIYPENFAESGMRQRGPHARVNLPANTVEKIYELTGGDLGCTSSLLGVSRETLSRHTRAHVEKGLYNMEDFVSIPREITPEAIKDAFEILSWNINGEKIVWDPTKPRALAGCLGSILGHKGWGAVHRKMVEFGFFKTDPDTNRWIITDQFLQDSPIEPTSLLRDLMWQSEDEGVESVHSPGDDLPHPSMMPHDLVEENPFLERESKVLADFSRWLDIRKFAFASKESSANNFNMNKRTK